MTEVAASEYPMFDKHTEALEIGFIDNMKIPLKRLFSLKVLISLVLAIVSLIAIMYIIEFVMQKVAASGMTINFPLLCLLMLSIPAWTISFASSTLLERKRKLNASGTAGILGRYVGTVIAGTILMTIVYAAVYGIWYWSYGNIDLDLVNSYLIMVSFVVLAAALALFFNSIFVHASAFTYLVLFILIPVLAFLIGPYFGIMQMQEVSSYMPLIDTIATTATDGFGGGTVLTASFVLKSSPPILADVSGSVVLSVGWALIFVALTIIVQYRREAKYEQQ
ncbi:MAG: hypothetical protein E7Z65_02360 [Thermoplasmata archaeon]|nr:hypothetical protein [Thermoplasmata archaeon]